MKIANCEGHDGKSHGNQPARELKGATKTIHAVYEEGVFRPLEKVELPERTEVEFEPKIVGAIEPERDDMRGIIEIMSRRFRSGQHDLAERHNEHQP